MLLPDRVVIISGVGPGLGRHLALACAREGAKLVLVARSAERLADVEAALAGQVPTVSIAGDASNPDVAEQIAKRTIERFGAIDGLVNNAATIPPFSPLALASGLEVRDSFDANFYTAFHMSRAAIPMMATRGRGSIVMVGSAVVRHPKPRFGAYNVAKHALLGLARSLALELGEHGVRVNTLAPGKIDGERLEKYFELRATEHGVPVAEVRAEYTSNIALGRLPSAEEYADVAVFLLSDLSRAITGHLLDANGGEYFD